MDDIERVKRFAGDYTIYTKNDKIQVNTQIFDKESVDELNVFLDKLELKK